MNEPVCNLHIPPHMKKHKQVFDLKAGKHKHQFKWVYVCDWCEKFGRGYGPEGTSRRRAKSDLAIHSKSHDRNTSLDSELTVET